MKHEITSPIRKYALWTAVILMAVTLFGCLPTTSVTPTDTPELSTITTTPVPVKCEPIVVNSGASGSVLHMPDGWDVHLAGNTEIELIPGGYCPEIQEHKLVLHYGQVAFHYLNSMVEKIAVTNPQGFIGTLEGTGLVTYDITTGKFQLACTNGACVIGSAPNQLYELVCGESGEIDQLGLFGGPYTIDLATLVMYGDWLLPTCELVGTPIPVTETPDAAATATAYCATFESEFPLTPCPSAQP